ncbi:MAG: sigma-70 family RNA polymerase sigma factor [Kiritimatiellae bacterium]|jgi:RNA polymerase sigma factor (sigma-70 family)|nr:sigma-70 family RNA polymerase sigma factor [Kiritimatiellia bacterium]
MQQDDPDLQAIRSIQQQDEQGLIDLMSRHRAPLFRFIYRFVRNEADAAELTEQTFLKVYLKADRYKPKAKVSTWMFSIAGNLCRDFLRRNKKRAADSSLDAPLGSEGNHTLADRLEGNAGTPEGEVVSSESLAAIEAAVDALPHRLKFPFIFCVLEDQTYDACAEILKTNRKTVEMRIYRARKLLREQLESLRS